MSAMRQGFATVAASLLFTACGGGGESSAPAPPTDQVAPVATLTAPANLVAGLTGTLTLTATATDDVGVASVEFQVDGSQVGNPIAAPPYTMGVDTSAYASGQHVVRTRARDAANNVSPWSNATVQFGGGRNQPAGFARTDVGTGLVNATAFVQAPDPDGRFFVAEQGGTLRIVKNGTLLLAPFIALGVDSSGERGLLGVALHPGFATNRYVYLYYTTLEGGTHNRISRFTASSVNPDTVSLGSEWRIADLPLLSATNHNGGAMHFGNDGKLYVAVGENAVPSNSQDLTTPLGKMLRFNDDGSIPSDNPFCTTPATLKCAIWAQGLRNPFTFAVRPSDGRIHINDVGQNLWEEIDLGARGANYGWPASEGPDNITAGVTAPLFAYNHNPASPVGSGSGGFFSGSDAIFGCTAIIGGAFYPDSGPFPQAYHGSYYFTDLCSGVIGRLDLDPANGNVAYAFGSVAGSPVGMLAGQDGALYVLQRDAITRFSYP
jgi:glucose/arabinose dehydrogenase